MRTILICHHDAPLDRIGLASWLAATTELVGIVEVHENRQRLRRRVKRELERVGTLRFADVLAFQLYYRALVAPADRRWEAEQLARLRERYGQLPSDVPVLQTHSPNSEAARELVEQLEPDLMIARCKFILKKKVFGIPTLGTFVMHPGVCPEYRNAHGCFWALATGDLDRVGMTLLKIDEGVDTGPVYGYFGADIDETTDSHFVVQSKVVLDNLEAIGETLRRIAAGSARPIDTSGRESHTWGQPWLSKHLAWKLAARRRNSEGKNASLPRRGPFGRVPEQRLSG